MDVYTLGINERMRVVELLDALKKARQTAYVVAKEMPGLRHVFDEAEALYVKVSEEVGARYQPVYDEEQHIADRIANGDAAHTFVHENITQRRDRMLPKLIVRGERSGSRCRPLGRHFRIATELKAVEHFWRLPPHGVTAGTPGCHRANLPPPVRPQGL